MKIKPSNAIVVLLVSITGWVSSPGGALGNSGSPAGTLTQERLVVTSETGDSVSVESGRLTLPENRSIENGATLSIAYYRLESTAENPGPAVFLLAGGPGASWIDSFEQDERFREVTFYQELSDVVLFDQRGAGHSEPNLQCEGRQLISQDLPLTEDVLRTAIGSKVTECRKHWKERGVDLSAYNTDESAADVDALRQALGYEKIILVGGSYGSHLGLHVLRKYPDVVDRAIFYGIEGPDHTWDMPSEKLAALERIAAATEAAPYYKGKIPEGGLLAALETVVERVSRNPVVTVLTRGEDSIDVEVNALVVTAVASRRAGKRSAPLVWPDLILAMYNGDYSMPAQAAMGMRSISPPNAMSHAMDVASGISPGRRKQIAADPAARILGDINRGYNLIDGLWQVPDLGEDFRADVVSDVPTLLVHGTWDTSTPIENAREVAAGLRNGHLIEVVGGTHGALYNLYEHWPPMHDLVARFLRGDSVEFPKEVEMEPVEFPELSTDAQNKLWNASKSGDSKAVLEAIDAGADVNALDTRRSRTGRRPLNWAAFYGHIEIIEILLAAGANIDGTNLSGFTPIHHATENNEPESAAVLLKAGADTSIRNKKGKSPLDTATEGGFDSIVAMLDVQD